MLLREYIGKSLPLTLNGETKEIPYLTRIDPLSGTVAKVSPERAKRNLGINTAVDIHPVKDCQFCDLYQFTPEQRINHGCGAVSVANKFPWEKYDWVTIYPPFGQHKLLLSDLYFDDLERLIESSYDLAAICAKDPEVLTFIDFTNWGPFAGASQQHPHSQRKSATFVLDPQQERERSHCRELAARYEKNPFDMLADEERADKRRLIYDNDVFIAAAFAPTFPNEIIVFPKEPISHILQTTWEQRSRMIRPILGLFPALFFYRGITDLNIGVHQAPFQGMEEARRYYRWHMHIYPRRPTLPADRGGAELAFEVNVIDTLPEATAEILRAWYQAPPREELLAKLPDGSPNPHLKEAFRRFMSNSHSSP